MRETWRLIDSGASDPYYNMAVDEAILIAHSEGLVPPTVRFYGWNPATLSIGYFQKANTDVNHTFLHDKRLGFVRRPTGGRAVLHDQELTYSVIVQETHPMMPSSVNESYRILSNGLMEGFRLLGLSANMVSLANVAEKDKYASLGSAACFDSPSWYELVVEGRKIVGSAQVRQRGMILQHGSILLDLDVDLLFSCLQFSSDRVKERMKRAFLDKAVSIQSLSGRSVDYKEARAAFANGFSKGLDIDLQIGNLHPREQELATALVEQKYGTDSWNFKK